VDRARNPERPSPCLPRRASGAPELFELPLVAERVHRLPEPVVTIGGQLTFACEALERLLLPHGVVARNVVEDGGGEDEEAAVDPAAVPSRLLLKRIHLDVVELERPEAPRRADGGQRRR